MRLLFLLLLPAMALAAPADRVTFTTPGYIEVYAPDGSFISRHRLGDEAKESAFNFATSTGQGGDYILRPPDTRMNIRLVTPTPDPDQPSFTPDLTYTTTAPSGDSIHPNAPAGSTAEVEILSGTDVRVLPNGSTSAASASWSVAARTRTNGVWTQPETITWR